MAGLNQSRYTSVQDDRLRALRSSSMTKPCAKPVKTNPFLTYRDPTTGRWIVVKVSLETTAHYQEMSSKSSRADAQERSLS